ncbi:hypothetical protein M942_24435 [Enterobacter ludwigii]|nr:hypothetical protein M942_24435 [Enterobacter ludwigii]
MSLEGMRYIVIIMVGLLPDWYRHFTAWIQKDVQVLHISAAG